jgi:hypothetical protein
MPTEKQNTTPGTVQISSGPQTPTTVEFWSQPTGAEIDIDNTFVGSTPSTIPLPSGEHTITIRKQDFRTWQKTLTVTSGSVRVATYMEQARATVPFNQK